jgi:hypothetical protein
MPSRVISEETSIIKILPFSPRIDHVNVSITQSLVFSKENE